MHLPFLLAALLASSATAQEAQRLDKPAAWPNLDFMGPRLNRVRRVDATISRWSDGTVSRGCRSAALDKDRDPTKFAAFTVTFADCDRPWLICRERSAPGSIAELVDTFAKLPVGLRQWVNDIVHITPGVGGTVLYSTVVVLSGTAHSSLPIAIHEAMHAAGFYAGTGMYWDSEEFRAGFRKDSHVADEYAQTNHIENFAQYAGLIIYNRVTDGKLEQDYPVKYRSILNQLQTQAAGADRTDNALGLASANKKCTRRWSLEPAVDAATGQIIDGARAGLMPDKVADIPSDMFKSRPATNCTFV